MLRTWLSAALSRKNQSSFTLKFPLRSFRFTGRDDGGGQAGRKVKKNGLPQRRVRLISHQTGKMMKIMIAKWRARRAGLREGRLIGLAFLTAGLVLFAGCASPNAANQIQSFSTAVSLTMSNTAAAYNLVDAAHVQAQFGQFVVDGNPSQIESDTFSNFFSTNDIQVRQRVLDCLQTYATRLSQLMGNPGITNLDQKTTQLGQNLQKLDNDAVTNVYLNFFSTATNFTSPLTTTDLQIFTTAVNALTDWILELKEQSQVKKCIETMQAPTNLPSICHVLTNDFLYLTKQLDNDEKTILLAEKQFIHASLLEPIQRRAEMMRLVRLEQDAKKAFAVLEQTRESIVKLQAAHQQLANAFSNNPANLSTLINEVSADGQRIAAYYNSLRTNN
jgi:hypothetical protein